MNDVHKDCPYKIQLFADIQAAMGNLLSIHNEEVVALLAEDFVRLQELRDTLQGSRDRKAKLIDDYREHVNSHGC